jgi:hypothetical protein
MARFFSRTKSLLASYGALPWFVAWLLQFSDISRVGPWSEYVGFSKDDTISSAESFANHNVPWQAQSEWPWQAS